MRIESAGTTGKAGKATAANVDFDTFTVVHVDPEDIHPGERMAAFLAKWGGLVGLTHDDLDDLPGAVAARYSAGPPPGPVG